MTTEVPGDAAADPRDGQGLPPTRVGPTASTHAPVGLDNELALVGEALADVCAGEGRVVFVSGSAGVGKSTLVHAIAAEAARRGMVTLRGCGSTIDKYAPLWALAEALSMEPKMSGALFGDDRLLVLRAESLLQLLARVAGVDGALLILEDLHEADLETLAMVEYLVDHLIGRRLMVVCTQRSGGRRAAEFMERPERRNHTIRIDLSGLTPRALGEMAADYLRDHDVAAVEPALVEHLWQISAGNPSLARQLLQVWRDEGTVVLGPGGWAVAEGPGLDVPNTLARATSARIRQLDQRSKRLLQAAAVIGTRFPLSLLGRIVTADPAALLDFARRAVDVGLLVPYPGRPGWYCFAHPLGVRAVQARTTHTDKTEAAILVAAVIEERLPHRPSDRGRRAADLRASAAKTPPAYCLPYATSTEWTRSPGIQARTDAQSRRAGAGGNSLAERDSDLDVRVRFGAGRWLANGDTSELEQAGRWATETTVRSDGAGLVLSLDAVLRSEFARFDALGAVACADLPEPQIRHLGCSLLAVRAIAAAHRGRRAEMETLTAQLRNDSATHAAAMPLVRGLGRAFALLFEVDLVGARRELRDVEAADGPKPSCLLGPLDGRYGLALLLDVLAGTRGWPDYRAIAGLQPALLRWNQHFTELAHAVLLGRNGSAELASTAMGRAAEAGSIYPTAAHLGALLVATEAHRGGWGQPMHRLRVAEDYFFRIGNTAAVGACRKAQRAIGGPLRQRRHGSHRIPGQLRVAGVTAREFEVLVLLAESSTNKRIAAALYLSPRTVERHVANLLAKTGRANRTDLAGYYLDCRAAE